MGVPVPENQDQQRLLQIVWDLLVLETKWPTFRQVDHLCDKNFGYDVHEVSRDLPRELLYPPMDLTPPPDQELRLTIAGVNACSGGEESVQLFIESVRLAAEIERAWQGPPIDGSDEPVMTADDVVRRIQLPAAGREALLAGLGLLLAVEPCGWKSAAAGNARWQLTLGREVRRFRNVSGLDDYWAARTQALGRPKGTSASGEREPVATTKRIFISHAAADRQVAELLRETLVLGGVPSAQLFYSSARATGVPSGEDVRAHLLAELNQAGLIIELLTTTFFTRSMCLIELGAAWALGKPTYPIVVPPLTRERAIEHLGNVHMGHLVDQEAIADVFDELSDRLTRDAGVHLTATQWNPVARRFYTKLPVELGAPPSPHSPTVTTSPPPLRGRT